MKIYIAGPMSGHKDYNYPAFHAAARRLRGLGYHVECPAENTPPTCGSWSGYMRIAIKQMLGCDTVALLPGWIWSRGAKLECFIAWVLGIKVVAIGKVESA